MDNANYSLSDLAAVTNGAENWSGNNLVTLLLLFALISGNGLFGNRGGDYSQFATSASQQEILFNQHFNNLDNKMDRGFTSIGNGISDATFALNNTIVNGNNNVAGTVITEGRAIQDKLCDIKTSIHAEGEATRAMIQQDKIESLQGQINQLQLQNAMYGVVRYPNQMAYNAGSSPFCGCNSGCCR